MTKRKTRRYKKKMQKVQVKGTKKTPKYKYKIVTSTGFPLLKKTSYANNVNSAKRIAKTQGKKYMHYLNLHKSYYYTESTTRIYVWSPRFQKYKRLGTQTYKTTLYRR